MHIIPKRVGEKSKSCKATHSLSKTCSIETLFRPGEEDAAVGKTEIASEQRK